MLGKSLGGDAVESLYMCESVGSNCNVYPSVVMAAGFVHRQVEKHHARRLQTTALLGRLTVLRFVTAAQCL